MKYLAGVSILILSISTVKAGSFSSAAKDGVDSVSVEVEKLKRLYLLATNSSVFKEKYEQEFFDEFPNTFDQLNKLYGYDSTTDKGPLYFEAENHIIKLFNNLKTINDTLYYKKIVLIAIGGTWDGDAINYFQNGLHAKVENDPGLIVYILKSMNAQDEESFWRFYFDEPHPPKAIPGSLMKIRALNEKIYWSMIKAHNAALLVQE